MRATHPTTDWSLQMPLGRIERFDPQIVQDLIKKQGYTQLEVAVALGVGPASVNRYLSGMSSPSPARAKALADLLSVDVLDLSGKTLSTADIVDLRQRIGLTAKEVSEKTGVSHGQMQALETAAVPPPAARLSQLTELYDEPLDVLKRAWINRRIYRFGADSLRRLPKLWEK